MNDKLETTYGRAVKDLSHNVENAQEKLDLFLFEEPFQLTSSNFQIQIWVRYEIDRIVWSNQKSKYTIMHISQAQFHKIKDFYNWILW